MAYEWKRVATRGGYRLSRVAVSVPKGAVTIEPAQPATVAKVDIDSGETVAVERPAVGASWSVAEPVVETAAVVPTTPKSTAKPKAKPKAKS